jgi:eukaryotic-like serine/threonine-protein kinase
MNPTTRRDLQALPPASARSHRSWYGGYYLVDAIGKGGMAEIFRAVRPGEEGFLRTVALKRISPAYAHSESFVQMFCEEARVSAMLSHPNIVQVYEFGKAEGTYFMAMEYLRGRDLLTVMRSNDARKLKPPAKLVTFIAQKVASALGYVHELRGPDGAPLNLVHRDVSPANIMLLKRGGVKVLDFGIAKSPSLQRQQTQAGFVKGKMGYISPEQARCETLDGRSDIFSLGVTLWEALTGTRLFRAPTEYETVRNVLNLPILPPSSLNPEVPEKLEQIVMSCLQRAREDRPASAKRLAAQLSDCLRDDPATDEDVALYLGELYGDHSSQVIPIVREELLAAPISTPATPPPTPRALPAHERPAKIVPLVDPARLAPFEASPSVAVTPTSLPRLRRPSPRPSPSPAPPPQPSKARGIAASAIVLIVMGLAVHQWLWPALTRPSIVAKTSANANTTLALHSDPEGATVLDSSGHALGVTPVTLQRPRNATAPTLELRLAGYDPARITPTTNSDVFLTVPLVESTR